MRMAGALSSSWPTSCCLTVQCAAMHQTASPTDADMILQRLDTAIRLCSQVVEQNRQLQLKLDLMAASQDKITISLAEACQRLGISRSTMMGRLKKGMYPYAWQDVGGQWRFPVDKLLRYGCNGS